jgi:ABC-type tungstate transport system permease subunit
MHTPFTMRQTARAGAHTHTRGLLRLASPLAGLATAAMLLLSPGLAAADTSSTLTVIGTSDVSDSGLIPNLIGPQFEKAFPKITFKYIGTASGTAITSAETGSQGASALIVHAPTLENQFVAGGYSYQTSGSGPSTHPYGSAIWTNDFVFAGPTGDPAGVAANGSSDITAAFVDVAKAGVLGKATFVSRGGTPGTTTEEHKIWGLVESKGLTPSGVELCAVSAKLGGGMTPIAPGGVSANGDACPGGVLPGSAGGGSLPSWYVTTGLTQGPNVVAANACTTYSKSGANTCYVLTDRGTYDYLASGTDPAGSVKNLKIVSSNPQSISAPAGQYGLINYFHAYVLNPKKVPGVNVTAAQDFVNFLTSPEVQDELHNYLPTSQTGDPLGPPFVATANPTITAKGFPATYKAATKKKVTVTGNVKNKELGFPVLNAVQVAVSQVGNPVPIKTAKTNVNGDFTISFTPPVNAKYEITTGFISKIENSSLNPVFGDMLSPSASPSTKVTVKAAITKLSSRPNGAGAMVIGTVAPGFGHVKGKVTISARPAGSKKDYKKVATAKLKSNDGNFAAAPKLAKGKWQLEAVFSDPKQVVASPAKTTTVKVGAKPKTSVALQSVKLKGQTVHVSATVKPKPTASGGSVKVLVLKAKNGSKAALRQKAKASVKKGKTSVSLKAKLNGPSHYVLELKYRSKGQAASYTQTRSVTIKSTK